MTQKRLNSLATLFTHSDLLDMLDIEKLMNLLIKKNNIRAATFAM